MKTSIRLQRDRFSRFTPIVAIVVALSLFVSGCTTMQSVAVPGPRPDGAEQPVTVSAGDEVEIHLRNGQIYSFKVTAIESDSLVGGKIRVKFSDMTELKVRKVSKGYTAVTVGAILTTVLIGVVVYALAHMGPGMSGG
jgi:hypothetical protein